MAGLFALLYGLFTFTDGAISSAKEHDFMRDSRTIAIEKGELTYMNSRGYEFFVETNELCMTTIDRRNGHRVIETINKKGLPTGRILYDYTEKEKERKNAELEKAIEEAKAKGQKYLDWYFPTIEGRNTVVEVETGRKLQYSDFYFNTNGKREYFFHYLKEETMKKRNVQGYMTETYLCEEHGHCISEEEYNRMRKGI